MLLSTGSTLFAAEPATEFKQRCAQCHGADAKGNTTIGKSLKIPDLTGEEIAKVSDSELAQVISEGRGSMPAFKGVLDQTTIKQIIGYIRTLQKPARKVAAATRSAPAVSPAFPFPGSAPAPWPTAR